MFVRGLFLFAVSVLAADPPFPKLPDDFSAHIEAVIADKNYTLDMKEYYDYSNERFRIETHRNGSYHVELCDLKAQSHFVVDRFPGQPFNCTVQNVSTCRTGPQGSRVTKASDFLGNHNATWLYSGEASTRGVKCDTWISNATMNMSAFPSRPLPPGSPPRPALVKYDLTWYFQKPYWSNRGEANQIKPVALYMNASNYDTKGVFMGAAEHWYNFIDFLPTLSAVEAEHRVADLFIPSSAWKCPGRTPPPDTAVSCGPDTENKNGKCVCRAPPVKPTASSFELLESHKTLVAVLPAVGLVAAVKFFM